VYSFFILLRVTACLHVVDAGGAPKHVGAEDIELFRQACNITRQVISFSKFDMLSVF